MVILLVIKFLSNIKTRGFSLMFIGLFMSTMAFSQVNSDVTDNQKVRKNSVDLTLGGSGLFLSANYSRTILVKPSYFVNASAGIGTVVMIGGVSVPHQLTFNFGKKSSFLELGLGGTFWTGKSNDSGYTETISSYYLSPIVGWRKNFDNNLVFRAYANPLIYISGAQSEYAVTPFMGISLGYKF